MDGTVAKRTSTLPALERSQSKRSSTFWAAPATPPHSPAPSGPSTPSSSFFSTPSKAAVTTTAAASSPFSQSPTAVTFASVSNNAGGAVTGSGAPDTFDVLVDRANGWKALVSSLLNHFEELVDAEKLMAKSYEKVNKAWVAPSSARDLAFGPDSAIRSLVQVMTDEAMQMAASHSSVAKSLEMQTVAAFAALKKELKKKVDTLEDDQKARGKERLADLTAVQKAKDTFHKALNLAKKTGSDSERFGDPYLCNLVVQRQLTLAQTHHEARSQALEAAKKLFMQFEADVIRTIRSTLNGLAGLAESRESVAHLAKIVDNALRSLDADREWRLLCAAKLNSSSGPRMFESMEYEGSADPLVKVIREGTLQRKTKGPFKTFKEHYYILTGAGYLHEFKTRPHPERMEKVDPDDSIFLGDCTLEPYSVSDRKPEEFHLTEKKSDGKMFRSSTTHKFLGSSMAVTKEWHESLGDLVKTAYAVVGGKSVSRSGTVGAPNSTTASVSQSEAITTTTVTTVTRSVTVAK